MPAKAAAKTAAKKTVTKRQNVVLARGINAISRNSLARSNGRRNFAKKGGDKKVKSVSKPSTKKWYPADYIPKPLPSAKTLRNSVKTAKLRKSIVPGSVLILLSGRFRGKRVVFLKQLASGLLLVTGKASIRLSPTAAHSFFSGSNDANLTSRGNRTRTLCVAGAWLFPQKDTRGLGLYGLNLRVDCGESVALVVHRRLDILLGECLGGRCLGSPAEEL